MMSEKDWVKPAPNTCMSYQWLSATLQSRLPMNWSYHCLALSHWYIDGLVQDCSNSIANAMEFLQSCTKPSVYCDMNYVHKTRVSLACSWLWAMHVCIEDQQCSWVLLFISCCTLHCFFFLKKTISLYHSKTILFCSCVISSFDTCKVCYLLPLFKFLHHKRNSTCVKHRSFQLTDCNHCHSFVKGFEI